MRRMLRALIALLVAAALAADAAPAFAQVVGREPDDKPGATLSCNSSLHVMVDSTEVRTPAMPKLFCGNEKGGGNSKVGRVG